MAYFICPHCGEPLQKEGNALRCSGGHAFDRAKSGYVNLIPVSAKRSKNPGDNKLMVNARREFLEKGYYAPLAEEFAHVANRYFAGQKRPVLLDAGCGEGYYTQRMRKACANAEIFAVDISKFAADRCAKRCPEVQCAAASVFHLPMAAESCDGVTSLFAPYCGEEYQRVLRAGGIFLMVIPGRRHLWELKTALYEEAYENEVKPYPLEGFAFLESTAVDAEIFLPTNADITSLFQMTPYYYKSGVDTDAKLAALTQLKTRISFEILAYCKNECLQNVHN